MLCAWHIINNNLEANCKKSFKTKAKYEEFKSFVWDLQSSSSILDKTTNFDRCKDFAKKHSNDPNKVCNYLESLMNIEEQWIRCYVDQYPHMGTYTTGRGESQHSALKINISSLSSLVHAFREINKVLQKQREHQQRENGKNKATFLAMGNKNLFKELETRVSKLCFG